MVKSQDTAVSPHLFCVRWIGWSIVTVWCICAPDEFVLLCSYLQCDLLSYIQFNLHVLLPVVEMWSRLQAASGMQPTDLLIMPEADEDFCFPEITTKHPKNYYYNYYIVVFSGEVGTVYHLCFAGSFYIFEKKLDRQIHVSKQHKVIVISHSSSMS